MYSYDRQTKTAATMDAHSKWRDIVDKHEAAEHKEMEALLKEMAKYLKSVGLDLDVGKSYLGKEYHGSDGVRRAGELVVSERAENNILVERPEMIAKWVAEATDMHGSARRIGTGPGKRQVDDLPIGIWAVDISEY